MDHKAQAFMAKSPYLLATVGAYRLYEHPTRGDTAPVYMVTPSGNLISTGFYDLEDLDLAMCLELDLQEQKRLALERSVSAFGQLDLY